MSGLPYDPYFVQDRYAPNKDTHIQQLDQRWRQADKNVKLTSEKTMADHNQLSQERGELLNKLADNHNRGIDLYKRTLSQANEQIVQQQKIIRDIREEIFNNQRQMAGLAMELMSALQQRNYDQVNKISQTIYKLGQDNRGEQRDIILFK